MRDTTDRTASCSSERVVSDSGDVASPMMTMLVSSHILEQSRARVARDCKQETVVQGSAGRYAIMHGGQDPTEVDREA